MPWIRLAFTLTMLALAALHQWLALDKVSVGLAVAALAPWILPELQSIFKTIKIPGVLEAELRDLKEQVKAQQVALDTGVGGKTEPAAAVATAVAASPGAIPKPVSYSVRAAEDDDDGPPVDPTDPNKHRFGSSPSAGAMRLNGEVKPFPGSDRLFKVRLWVTGAAPADTVKFYLHPTFRRPVLDAETGSDGIAALDLVAWGAFTVGAIVTHAGKITKLELDLAKDVPGAPAEFRAR